jgi:hypothetical protein
VVTVRSLERRSAFCILYSFGLISKVWLFLGIMQILIKNTWHHNLESLGAYESVQLA